MTKPLRALISIVSDYLPKYKEILEVGSRQAKNQEDIADLRVFFPGSSYVGVDMQDGPGVDVVQKGERLPFKDKSKNLVLCLETFEHCDKPWKVAKEIERVVSNRGLVIVSSQQNFPIHMHPSDYFRYTPFGMMSLFPSLKEKMVVAISPPFDNEVKLNPQHVVLIGSKNKNNLLFKRLKKEIKRNKSKISVHKPYRHRIIDGWKYVKRGLLELFFRQEIEFF